MALYEGVGILQAPSRTPICEVVRITATFPDGRVEETDVLTPDLERVWENFFSRLADIAQNGGNTPAYGTLYVSLTPAATVTPTLELVDQNGTLGILLDRATTTIAPATLDGLTPPDGYRFSLALLNDGTDGREVVFNAAYIGCQETSGMADAFEMYSFVTIGGLFVCTAQNIGVL